MNDKLEAKLNVIATKCGFDPELTSVKFENEHICLITFSDKIRLITIDFPVDRIEDHTDIWAERCDDGKAVFISVLEFTIIDNLIYEIMSDDNLWFYKYDINDRIYTLALKTHNDQVKSFRKLLNLTLNTCFNKNCIRVADLMTTFDIPVMLQDYKYGWTSLNDFVAWAKTNDNSYIKEFKV